MGEIRDIIDLAKELESRSKDRKDLDTLQKIHSLAMLLLEKHADFSERNFELLQENQALKKQLTEAAEVEETRIHHAIEFRKGRRTGRKWLAFCPKCHMPALEVPEDRFHLPRAICSAGCGWGTVRECSFSELFKQLE